MSPPRSPALAFVASQPFWQVSFSVLLMAVTILALMPAPPEALTSGSDKLNHALAFGSLGCSGCLGSSGSRRAILLAAMALIAFGALIEVIQLFIPGRSAEWLDLAADAIGIACGSGFALLLLRLRGTG